MLQKFLRLNYLRIFLLCLFSLFSTLGCGEKNDPPNYYLGGTTSGLGTGLSTVLQDTISGGDIYINQNGPFTSPFYFFTSVNYNLIVRTQPTGQTCVLTNGSGTTQNQSVTNIVVTCADTPQFTVGGTITGITVLAETVVLQNNGGDNLSLTTDGSFTFSTPLANGAAYSVTILTQPFPGDCTVVANGSGTITDANVTNVSVTCTP